MSFFPLASHSRLCSPRLPSFTFQFSKWWLRRSLSLSLLSLSNSVEREQEDGWSVFNANKPGKNERQSRRERAPKPKRQQKPIKDTKAQEREIFSLSLLLLSISLLFSLSPISLYTHILESRGRRDRKTKTFFPDTSFFALAIYQKTEGGEENFIGRGMAVEPVRSRKVWLLPLLLLFSWRV